MISGLKCLVLCLTALVTCTQANCLIESYTIGIEEGIRFSNYDQIEELGSEQYVLKKFKTCENRREDIVGLQFTVVNKDDPADEVELEPVGDVTSDGLSCRNLKLSDGRIEKIRAGFNNTEKAITGIRYFKGVAFVKFGDMNGSEQEWYFDSDNELIGAHGYIKDGVFVNIGFVVHTTNDALCPIVEEPVIEEPVIEEEEEEPELVDETGEEEPIGENTEDPDTEVEEVEGDESSTEQSEGPTNEDTQSGQEGGEVT